jgi:hypothetical protein
VSGQLHALATLPPGDKPLIPTEQELGGAPKPVWMWWQREKNNHHCPCWELKPGYPAHSLVPTLTELPWLDDKNYKALIIPELLCMQFPCIQFGPN